MLKTEGPTEKVEDSFVKELVATNKIQKVFTAEDHYRKTTPIRARHIFLSCGTATPPSPDPQILSKEEISGEESSEILMSNLSKQPDSTHRMREKKTWPVHTALEKYARGVQGFISNRLLDVNRSGRSADYSDSRKLDRMRARDLDDKDFGFHLKDKKTDSLSFLKDLLKVKHWSFSCGRY